LSLRLLVDEDCQSRHLVKLLRESRHDVVTVNEAGLAGESDEAVLAFALAKGRITLTANVRDFWTLHQAGVAQGGVLGMCHDGDPSKDMTWGEIVEAIGHMEAAQVEVPGGFHILNAWRR